MVRNLAKIIFTALTSLLATIFASAAPADISNIPLFLSQPVGFNLMVTIDDSGSMDWEELPDNMVGSGTMRGSANSYNPLAYDPTISYIVPPWPDATGSSFSTMSVPTFTAAFNDGFAYKTGTATSTSSAGVGANYAANSTSNLDNDYRFNQRDTSVRAFYAVYDPVLTASACPVANVNSNFCYVMVTLNSATSTKSYFKSTPGCANINNVNSNVACFTVVTTQPTGVVAAADERLNFAIWYSYYRKRTLLAKSAALRALSSLPTNTRVGCHVLNSNGTPSVTCSKTIDYLREFSGSNQLALFERIARIPTGNSTPLKDALRRVGAHFQTTDVNSPWAFVPGTTSSPQLACRRSFHMMLTDGYYNSNSAVPSPMSSADTTPVTLLPDGKTSFDGNTKPYSDINNGSLADIAFYYWRTNLNPTMIAGKVPPSISVSNPSNLTAQFWNPNNDPATWPHLVNFNVALGLKGQITGITPAERDTTLLQLINGSVIWPTPVDNTATAIDDLWHAAINSRGDFYSAAKSDELVTAFQDIINRTQEASGSAAGISVTSATANGTGFAYQSIFDSSNWTGQIIAYPVSADGSFGLPVWKTSDPNKIPNYSTRKVDTVVDGAVQAFTYGNLNASQKSIFLGPTQSSGLPKITDMVGTANASSAGDWLANYLKGDASHERSTSGGAFRKRLNSLGDILNSGVLYVSARDSGYGATAISGSSSYDAYVKSKAALPKILVAGANDGMVHFFNAIDGVETYGFVPPVLLNKLYQLAVPSYGHQYYVDGQFTESDYFDGTSWRTVVIGSTGLGGAAVFAFDITGSNRSAPKLLWYIDANSNNCSGTSCADLGYGIGAVRVTQFGDGNWYAVFGNGYESGISPSSTTPGQAKLFAVRMTNSASYIANPTVNQVAVVTSPAGANGLSTPAIVSSYNRAYAGDLLGNMWRFDFAGSTPTVGLGGKALFHATSASGQTQPITSQPNVFAPRQGGLMVTFGTGRLYKQSDLSDLTVQSLYAVRDLRANGTLPYTRSSLMTQTILTQTTVSPINRTTSSNIVNLATQVGWYLDLQAPGMAPTGERVLASPLIAAGRTDFATYIPTGVTTSCDVNSNSFFMSMGSFSGDMGTVPIFDTNGDGQITSADAIVSGLGIGGSISSPTGSITALQPDTTGGAGPACVSDVACGVAGKTSSCGTLSAAHCVPAAGMALRQIYNPDGTVKLNPDGTPALEVRPADSCAKGELSVRIAEVSSTNTTTVCMPFSLSKPRMGWREVE